MKNIHLINWVRILLIVSGVLLSIVLFVPLWQIQLSAPQYPEGLVLKLYPHKIAGNVDIINGLNHYIGMKSLHTKDFAEFTILPFIIVFFALCCIVVAISNKKKWLIVLTSLFIFFGIVAMADFWRWEYNYGHDLNPEAAIQIPGMAYQPPLIGYKQLLNFGAYSIPDIGGFIFIAVGVLLLFVTIMQIIKAGKNNTASAPGNKKFAIATGLLLIFISSCNNGPQPIKMGVDACSFCKMAISDNRFGAEIITKKSKVYKFDDIHCLQSFKKSNSVNWEDVSHVYFVKFNGTHELIEASNAYLFKSDELHTPMGGNIAAFENERSLNIAAQTFKGNAERWNDLVK